MPRGSKPGERRGGRQRGTPNKKTALRKAALLAASHNPNLLPIDFLLRLMRDTNVPLAHRVDLAAAAAPFVHVKEHRPVGKAAIPRYGGPGSGAGTTKGLVFGPSRSAIAKLNGAAAATTAADVSPLDFLLWVMNDPDAPPALRVKAAHVAAPYIHAKAGPNPLDVPVSGIDDPDGLVVDAAVVRQLRDELVHRYSLSRDDKELRVECDIRIAKLMMSLPDPPPGFTPPQGKERTRPFSELDYKRKTRGLTAEEVVEEARVIARHDAGRSVEDRAFEYCRALKWKASLTSEEQSEFDRLMALYPNMESKFADAKKTQWERLMEFRAQLAERRHRERSSAVKEVHNRVR
jgi:hypothetical protein